MLHVYSLDFVGIQVFSNYSIILSIVLSCVRCSIAVSSAMNRQSMLGSWSVQQHLALFLCFQGFVKYVISQNGDGLHKLSGIPNVSFTKFFLGGGGNVANPQFYLLFEIERELYKSGAKC